MKAVAGRNQIQQVISERHDIEKNAPIMIDGAFEELQQIHKKMLNHELPGNTAAVSPSTSRVMAGAIEDSAKRTTLQATRSVRTEAKLLEKANKDVKTARAQTNKTNNATKKAGRPKKRKWKSGVPGEHITDYFVKRKHATFVKVNNGGNLTEENSNPHTGIDHLWANERNPVKPFVVGETKSRLFDSLTLIAALPNALAEKFAVLRSEEASNPTPGGQPNTFHSAGRDAHADQVVRIKASTKREDSIRASVNPPGKDKDGNPTGLATQMSHQWINDRLEEENLVSEGLRLKKQLRLLRLSLAGDEVSDYPYKRWISLVTGRQLSKHQKSRGSIHEVQLVVDLPNNILKR